MLWEQLWLWWKRRGRHNLKHLHFVMYSRPECSLCEKAWKFLNRQQALYQFSLQIISIEDKKELQEQFSSQIPVVTMNGKVRFRGVINPVLFERLMHAESRNVVSNS